MTAELPMICTCSSNGVQETESRRLRIYDRMKLKNMRDLTDAIVLSLAFDFSCDAHVCADQWFGITLTTPLDREGLFIPCDDPVDGFAALWEHLAERFPERVSTSAAKPKSRATERISTMLLAQYIKAEADYRAHRDTAHDGPNDYPSCEDCEVRLSLTTSAQLALTTEWGSRSLDACVEAAMGAAAF